MHSLIDRYLLRPLTRIVLEYAKQDHIIELQPYCCEYQMIEKEIPEDIDYCVNRLKEITSGNNTGKGRPFYQNISWIYSEQYFTGWMELRTEKRGFDTNFKVSILHCRSINTGFNGLRMLRDRFTIKYRTPFALDDSRSSKSKQNIMERFKRTFQSHSMEYQTEIHSDKPVPYRTNSKLIFVDYFG